MYSYGLTSGISNKKPMWPRLRVKSNLFDIHLCVCVCVYITCIYIHRYRYGLTSGFSNKKPMWPRLRAKSNLFDTYASVD